jgi:hypothetical protein
MHVRLVSRKSLKYSLCLNVGGLGMGGPNWGTPFREHTANLYPSVPNAH